MVDELANNSVATEVTTPETTVLLLVVLAVKSEHC